MSTGMLRAGSSRRSKTKSPYARPARSTRSMPATDQARGPALATDQARATDPTLPTDQATTSSVQNIPQVPSSVPNACGMYSSPPAQMSTMPALEPQHSQPQGTSMSTVTSPLVAQHVAQIQAVGTMGRLPSLSSTYSILEPFEGHVNRLIDASLSSNTKIAYDKAINVFHDFRFYQQ
ncbi:uncharacterized protein LOC128176601 [Crassostrea angulata]|uniref:uncharacterized protein LOC128176601 n=2 Tax=Magallana angulata TaxID=2784310 RepID=UPI0022B08C21|nr:uncharacterized protein LOC128176601 [Crassostrea angulata]XP_052699004.1 uncharacterized protein LOC128176601 [Crassostrea angulata]